MPPYASPRSLGALVRSGLITPESYLELLGQTVTRVLRGSGRLRQSVAAHESVPFAIYSFLRHPVSFQDCLFCAALHSGDRDTVGAMACAIGGAYLGIEAIPQDWQEKIEHGLLLVELARGLWSRWQQHAREEASS